MGKKSRSRWKAEQEKLNRLPQDLRGNPVAGARTQAEADRIYGIGHQIENCMCDAVVKGWLEPTGWVEIRFTGGDFDGLLALGLQSYASRNPRDRAVYTGWDGDGYCVRIKPDRQWLNTIKSLMPGAQSLAVD